MNEQRIALTIAEAARTLGISRSGAYTLAREGRLPGAIKLGGRVLVSREVLERAVNGEQAGAATP